MAFRLQVRRFSGLADLEHGRCHLISRNGNPMSRLNGLGDQIAAALRRATPYMRKSRSG
jgi:hypothetical protein